MIMRTRWILQSAGLAALVLMLAGCGGSSSKSRSTASATQTSSASSSTSTTTTTTTGTATTTTSATTTAPTPGAKAPLSGSSVAVPGHAKGAVLPRIAARYTCDGADISPPIRWSGVPANSTEIGLFLVHLPGHGVARGFAFDWAVMGLKSKLHELTPGKLPPGAIVGRNSTGSARYSICPPKGKTESYGVIMYAFPHTLTYEPGFDPTVVFEEIGNEANAEGLLMHFSYKRA